MSNNEAFLSRWIQLLGILGRLKGWGCFLEVGNSTSTHLSWEASSKQGFSRASWAELKKQIGLRRKGIYPEAVKCSEQTFSRSGSQFKSLQGSSPRDRWVKMEIQHETLTLTQSCGKVQNCRSSKEEPNGWVSQKTTWHKKIHPRLKHLSGVTGILEEGLTNHNSPLLYKPYKSPKAKNGPAPNLACLFSCRCQKMAGSGPAGAYLISQCWQSHTRTQRIGGV